MGDVNVAIWGKRIMVYRMFHDDQELYSYETERLDGDLNRVYLLDATQDD